MKQVRQFISDDYFLLDLKVENLAEAYRQAMEFLHGRGSVSEEHRDEVTRLLLEREETDSTTIGHGAAVPHLYGEWFQKPVILFIRLARPLNLGALDGIPTQDFFLLLGPQESGNDRLDLLMHIARAVSDETFRYQVRSAKDKEDLLAAIDDFLERSAPVKEPEKREEIPEELAYTGRFAGGFMADIHRRLPHYASDFKDGLHPKTVSSTLFLLFACLAPAVTFGGFMSLATGQAIGTVEMIVATVICGVTFALLSGQPLIILGGTGPFLIFTSILFTLCGQLGIPFLPTYAWVGFWTALFVIILALTDSSCFMRYFTRFTDEIFAALISLIFISESIKAIVNVFKETYQTGAVNHDKALLTLLLAWGTYYFAMNLSGFRRSRYLRPQAREFLADFGPTIALVAMAFIAWLLRNDVKLDPLNAPPEFGTTSGRAWSVDFFSAPKWVWFAAAGPALLVTILVYLDQNITARLVNSPHHKLKKGGGYHLDLGIVGALIGICSIFGLPWLVAATVRSLNHVRSLATVEEVVSNHGDKKERIIHTRETRLSALMIHVLIGASLLMLPLLRQIPMAVLFGLFLYMGVVSMRGNQFFERLSLWPMDRSLYPATHYIRRAPLKVVHLFTLIQAVCLAILWVVKVSILGILFPLFIALLAPLRFWLNRFIDPKYLTVLDLEEDPEEEEEDWS